LASEQAQPPSHRQLGLQAHGSPQAQRSTLAPLQPQLAFSQRQDSLFVFSMASLSFF
jgi:hypothetical protein